MTSVFSIIGQFQSDKSKYQFLGTGFFIDNNGSFVTAGHIFRKNILNFSSFYLCFLEDSVNVELFAIKKFDYISKKIYSSDDRRDNIKRTKEFQKGPEYRDVGFGITELENTPHLIFQKKRPYECHDLEMPCYNYKENSRHSKDLTLSSGLLDCSKIEHNIREFELKNRLDLARIPFLGDNEMADMYNNCIEIHGVAVLGNSGAPLLNSKQKVIGIFIAGDKHNNIKACILSKYVLKQIRKMKHTLKKST